MVATLLTSVRKKFVMAVTGVMLLFFVVAHLVGNLQVFLGAEWLNSYAEHLEDLPALLWPARILLALALLSHMAVGIRLAFENRAARPVGYQAKRTIQASVASRTMVFSGLAIFFFVLFHLAHFTFGRIHPEFCGLVDAKGRHDVYSMVILSFGHAPTALFYILAMIFLSLHLGHGSSSFLQTLGLLSDKNAKCARRIGAVVGLLIFLGYASIPAASWLGWIKPLAGGGGLGLGS